MFFKLATYGSYNCSKNIKNSYGNSINKKKKIKQYFLSFSRGLELINWHSHSSL